MSQPPRAPHVYLQMGVVYVNDDGWKENWGGKPLGRVDREDVMTGQPWPDGWRAVRNGVTIGFYPRRKDAIQALFDLPRSDQDFLRHMGIEG